MHGIFTPMKWIWWRVVEQMFKLQFRLPKEMIPDTPIEVDLFSGGQILNYEFRDMLKSGEVSYRKGRAAKFIPSGIELTDGTQIEADMVIFGTGFTKCYKYLRPELQACLNRRKDGLYLYRNIFP